MDAVGTWGLMNQGGNWLVGLLVALLVGGVAYMAYQWARREQAGDTGEFVSAEPKGRTEDTTPEYRLVPEDVKDENDPPSSL